MRNNSTRESKRSSFSLSTSGCCKAMDATVKVRLTAPSLLAAEREGEVGRREKGGQRERKGGNEGEESGYSQEDDGLNQMKEDGVQKQSNNGRWR